MAEMQGLMERLERAVGRLELLSAGSHRPPGDCGEVNGVNGGVAPSVEAFDKLMNSMVAEFLKKSRILAGDVETHAEMVHSAFQAQRAFLLMASQYQQPQEVQIISFQGHTWLTHSESSAEDWNSVTGVPAWSVSGGDPFPGFQTTTSCCLLT